VIIESKFGKLIKTAYLMKKTSNFPLLSKAVWNTDWKLVMEKP